MQYRSRYEVQANMQRDKNSTIIAIALILALFGLGTIYLLKPTPEQINLCIEHSNYTYEQCVHKLTL